MEYEGQICRGPMEKGSYMLPVTVGCPYNKCKFCNLFKHLKFRVIQKDLVIKELKRVRDLKGMPKKVFLGDGSAFTLNY